MDVLTICDATIPTITLKKPIQGKIRVEELSFLYNFYNITETQTINSYPPLLIMM